MLCCVCVCVCAVRSVWMRGGRGRQADLGLRLSLVYCGNCCAPDNLEDMVLDIILD